MRAVMRLDRLRDDWNQLCVLAGYWRSAPGYQDSRWRKLEFRDTEHERGCHQQLSYRHLESRVIRPPRQEWPLVPCGHPFLSLCFMVRHSLANRATSGDEGR